MRWIAALIVAASTASAATIDEPKGDARYLEYGRTFSEYVVRVVGQNRDGVPLAGSGTVIARHWVLTAAHVTHEMVAVEIVVGTERHRVDRVFPHRHWTGEFARDDIALVHVDRPFAASVYPRLSDGTERLGTVAAVAGYGMTGTLQRGLTGGDQRLRAGSVLLGTIERDCYVCPIRRDAVAGPLPACIAPGDSGGPLWSKASDGTTRVVGVNSYVARNGGKTTYTLGEESGHTRVAKYLGWIHEVAGELDEACTMPGCHKRR